ncbi:kelch-like protein diablo [Haliotis asinina]|uniref:kelch-like protein diablo n=1 Tax=Haliotis asinina TaxID=109174 RepID=UPI0035318278
MAYVEMNHNAINQPVNFSPAPRRHLSLDSVASIQGSFSSEEEYHFTDSSHPPQMLASLNSLRQTGLFCDVIICVGGREFPCHRVVLASFSAYFRAMFACNLVESSQRKVTLNNVEPGIVETLLEFAYTSEILITHQNVQSLLSAANLFEILTVRDACCQYLERNMDDSNCIGIHCFAEAHDCIELQEKSKELILRCFPTVSLLDEYLQLEPDKLQELLQDDDLNIEHEEMAFEAVTHWLEHDLLSRKQHLAKLLSAVRLPLVSPYYLHDVVERNPTVNETPACRQLVDEAKAYHMMPDRRTELHTVRCRPRRCAVIVEVLISVGGEDDRVILKNVDTYDPTTNTWRTVGCLPFAVSKHGLVVAGGDCLYLVGGETPDGVVTSDVWCCDSTLHTWNQRQSMNNARSELGLTNCDGFIYAVGGWDGHSRLYSVERYCTTTNTWTYVTPMKMALTSPAVISLAGFVYVTGGAVLEDGDGIDKVSRYNPRADTWVERAPMLIARSGSQACALNGCIYVVGGWHASTENTNKMECYDPVTDTWCQKASMNERRYRPGVAVVGGKIYVCGGEEGWDRYHDTVECYSQETDSWEIVGEMHISRSWLGCVSMVMRKDMVEERSLFEETLPSQLTNNI